MHLMELCSIFELYYSMSFISVHYCMVILLIVETILDWYEKCMLN